MFHARLICSDDCCAASFEAWGSLEELDALACDCGCTLVVLTLTGVEGADVGVELQLVA